MKGEESVMRGYELAVRALVGHASRCTEGCVDESDRDAVPPMLQVHTTCAEGRRLAALVAAHRLHRNDTEDRQPEVIRLDYPVEVRIEVDEHGRFQATARIEDEDVEEIRWHRDLYLAREKAIGAALETLGRRMRLAVNRASEKG